MLTTEPLTPMRLLKLTMEWRKHFTETELYTLVIVAAAMSRGATRAEIGKISHRTAPPISVAVHALEERGLLHIETTAPLREGVGGGRHLYKITDAGLRLLGLSD
jgi:chromosome segregation and condensation protein ScpB